MNYTLSPIAHIQSDFQTKFGIPRQSRLAPSLQSVIYFEEKYRSIDALRGLEAYSHIWLIWQFSETLRETWSPMIRPPRLGGNKKVGVFASRSPFRPNGLGLSLVELVRIDQTKEGPCLVVRGADLMDGTPIFDIKPYLPFTESIPDAKGGYANDHKDDHLHVIFPEVLLQKIPPEKREALIETLAQDPRPSYQEDEHRVYGFYFCNMDIRFTVANGALTVVEIVK